MTVELKCNTCGGTKFCRTLFSYLWEEETMDVSTGEKSTEEIERESREQQEGWVCAKNKCYGWVESKDVDDEYEIEEAFERAYCLKP